MTGKKDDRQACPFDGTLPEGPFSPEEEAHLRKLSAGWPRAFDVPRLFATFDARERERERRWNPLDVELPLDAPPSALVLPRNGQLVLVSLLGGEVRPARFHFFQWWLDNGVRIDAPVLAWMPLPEPYKGKT